MNRAIAGIRLLRVALVARAYAAHSLGRAEKAQTYRAVVDDLTALIELLRRDKD